jgi:hypothetical protein
MKPRVPLLCCVLASSAFHAHAENRDIQIVNMILDDAVVHLFNFGLDPVDLDGWRFCTQSTTQVRRYTGTTGFDGSTMNAGESLFIHLNDDAPAVANHINVSSLGGAFAPLDLEAFAISFYFPGDGGFVNFGDETTMAEHIQFSRNGLNNFTADERSDEAVAAGLWTGVTDWISIQTDSLLIELTDISGGLLHGPDDYNVFGPACAADLTGDGVADIFDVLDFVAAYNANDPIADFTGDGNIDIFDVLAFVEAYNAGCP